MLFLTDNPTFLKIIGVKCLIFRWQINPEILNSLPITVLVKRNLSTKQAFILSYFGPQLIIKKSIRALRLIFCT